MPGFGGKIPQEELTQDGNKHWYFLGTALTLWCTWLAGTVMGVYLGFRVPEGWSLEFVLPLTFIALALPTIRDHADVAAALSAGVVAALAGPLLLNLGSLIAAVVGIAVGLLVEGRSR